MPRPGAAAPPAAWESLVVTGKARAAIRRATRVAVRTQYAGLGRRIVERLFDARQDVNIPTKSLNGALPRLARELVEEVLAAVGRGEMKASDVASAVYPDYKEERAALAPAAEGGERLVRPARTRLPVQVQDAGQRRPTAAAIPIRGINGDLPVRFAPNGGAVPGDRIVGILTPGEGITIYPIQSPALTAFDDAAGALARRALGHRRAHAAAFPGAHRRAVASTSRARWRRSPR